VVVGDGGGDGDAMMVRCCSMLASKSIVNCLFDFVFYSKCCFVLDLLVSEMWSMMCLQTILKYKSPFL